jgi:hypothetical protein
MRRVHPLFTLQGLVFLVIFFACLGVLYCRYGLALFSPGRLSARSLPGVAYAGFSSHAGFEAQCSRCHQPLRTTQDVLCMDCLTTLLRFGANYSLSMVITHILLLVSF